MKNILITGAAGFIGFHLCKKLIETTEYKVIALDNINNYYSVDLKYARLEILGFKRVNIKNNLKLTSSIYSNLMFYKSDIREKNTLNTIIQSEKIDIVCHLAAQAGVRYSFTHPEEYITNNQVGFFNIIDEARKNNISLFLYASSSSIYGLNTQLPFSESDQSESPASIYAATKKGNELLAHSYSNLYGLKTIGFRFFTVYGEYGRPDMALSLFSKAILEDKAINIFNQGKMQRDFTYIADIISGLTLVLQSPTSEKFKIYNIGRGKPEKLMNFISEIEFNLKKKAKKKFLPMQSGDVEATFADISRMQREYGYHPQTDIKEGIHKFINWYLKYYSNDKDSDTQ